MTCVSSKAAKPPSTLVCGFGTPDPSTFICAWTWGGQPSQEV